jgi:hypothetical protein
MRHDRLSPPVPKRVLGPVGPGWCNDFRRYAETLAAESEAATGYPLPGNQGFSADASNSRKDGTDA